LSSAVKMVSRSISCAQNNKDTYVTRNYEAWAFPSIMEVYARICIPV
jgi:hypothetical protein